MLTKTRDSHCDGPRVKSAKTRGLVEALEKSVGPDRRLDEAIARELGWRGGPGSWRAPDDDGSDPPRVSVPAFTGSIDAAETLLPEGFWWRGGTCGVSSEMRVCPDHNRPEHRERLLRECPPKIEHWNLGIEVTIWPGSNPALVRAFASACLRARDALLTSRKALRRVGAGKGSQGAQ